MYALIIGIFICIGGIIVAIATAKKDPWEEELNKPNGKVIRLDEYEAELGGDIGIVDEVQSN